MRWQKIFIFTVIVGSLLGVVMPREAQAATTRRTTKRVFLTSTAFTGAAIGGLSGANTICQNAANAKSLGGTWKALISDNATSASKNTTYNFYILSDIADRPVLSIDKMWNSVDATTAAYLVRKLNLDETSAVNTSGKVNVWTGTTKKGEIAGVNCTGFTVTTGTGEVGLIGSINSDWIDTGTSNCTNSFPIYCIEQ